MRISDWSSDVCSSDLNLRLPLRPSISEIEGQPQRAVDMAVTRLRPSISEIEGQPQPGTRRIDAIRGTSISEIAGKPQLGSTMTGCLGWPSILVSDAERNVCVSCRPAHAIRWHVVNERTLDCGREQENSYIPAWHFLF